MLGNVILLCIVLFSVFSIVGVQLWKGVLRNRCFLDLNTTLIINDTISNIWLNEFYQPEFVDSFLCDGMNKCSDLTAALTNKSTKCNASIEFLLNNFNKTDLKEMKCIDSSFYTKCRPSDQYPFNGAISFDNFIYAFLTIFQIINLESWSTIMYYIQDSHSFWNWIYFVSLVSVIFLNFHKFEDIPFEYYL